jgi:transcriptional regulator of acetoin/glycerol metabolism
MKTRTEDLSSGGDPATAGGARTSCLFFVLSAPRPLLAPACHVLAELDAITLGRGAPGAGRSADGGLRRLHVQVPDPAMSSTHARLARVMGRWTLEDSGSRNGTRVNDESIERVLLEDGDLIECGQTSFIFRTEVRVGPPEEAPPAGVPEGLATLWPPLARELTTLRRVAASPLPVLLLGESGTGKELLARAVHAISGRAGPFVGVNCGAIPESLVASELFGHRRGAFSGALEDRAGFVRAADGGTLLLDEIGDLPLEAQPVLLRVLEERQVVPVGDTRPQPVELRVVAATHQDLGRLVAEGRFRADLYARLAGHTFRLPSLRERREDLGLLVGTLLRRIGGPGAGRLSLSRDAARALLRYPWPLNVRELRQCLERAVILCGDGPIRPEHLPGPVLAPAPEDVPATATPQAAPPRSGFEGGRPGPEALAALLAEHGGNLSAVARALGKERTQVRRWMRQHRLSLADYRPKPR